MILSYRNVSLETQTIIKAVVKDLKLDEHRPLNIQIESRNLWNEKYHGYVCDIGEVHKDFRVVLNSQDTGETCINTIAHELRHVWQNVTRNYVDKEKFYINPDCFSEEDRDRYLNKKSEVDARKYAKHFVNNYRGEDKW